MDGTDGQTPSQTVGPYFTMRLAAEGDNVLHDERTLGTRIRIEGRVLDGDRAPIEDALIEIWQANAAGRYRHPADDRTDVPLDPAFDGFGRTASGFGDGTYRFETIKPGPVPAPSGGVQAPHVNVIVQARGMLLASHTRIYFGDERELNETDPVLRSVPSDRRSTLIARVVGVDGTDDADGTDNADNADDADGTADTHDTQPPTYRFDIRFQGDDETVFFDV